MNCRIVALHLGNKSKTIRKMEPAWEKVAASKFAVSEYKDSTGRSLPCYSLTKTEYQQYTANTKNIL